MLAEIDTQRLKLLALEDKQLRLYLEAPQELETELGFPLSRVLLSDRVRRAIEIKLANMALSAVAQHPWYTYWLIVVKSPPFGAGLAGFKGAPDVQGEVEIGYGVDAGYQNKGYMSEAARALVAWAFRTGNCRAVTAETAIDNFASQRVLEKLGMSVVARTREAVFWRIGQGEFREEP